MLATGRHNDDVIDVIGRAYICVEPRCVEQWQLQRRFQLMVIATDP